MIAEECMQLIVHDLIEGHLSTTKIADKYCDCASSELRDSLISDLEYVKHLYKLKKILND